MAFNSPAVILQAVADTLQQSGVANLPAQYPDLGTRAQARAYGDIVTVLASRGYSAAQVAAWDRGAEFELELANFWALALGGLLTKVDPTLLKMIDRRAELRHVVVTTAGLPVVPAGGSFGLPNSGRLDTSDDVMPRGFDRGGWGRCEGLWDV